MFHVRKSEFVIRSCQRMIRIKDLIQALMLFHISVTFSSDAPKNTSVSISPSDLVTAGSRVSLTCSSRANPPISSFTWFKNSKDGPIKVFEGQVYSFTATEGAVYYCVATNDLGEGTSAEILLNIKDNHEPGKEIAAVYNEQSILCILCKLNHDD